MGLEDIGSGAEALLDAGTQAIGTGGWQDVASGASGGFNWGDLASKLGSLDFGGWAKNLLPAAQLGLQGLGIYEGIQGAGQLAEQTKIAKNAAKTQQRVAGEAEAAAAPISQFSKEQLDLANQGKIPPQIQAQIDLWTKSAKQQAMDYAARAGIGDSSTLRNWMAWIDQQAQAMAASALQQEMSIGVQAGGTAGNVLSGAAGAAGGAGQISMNQQGSIQNLIEQANQVMAKLTSGAA